MTQQCDLKLKSVLADLQTRYGDRIIAPARPLGTVRIPTGIDSLDEALVGGLAQRKLTQITGQLTSGATSLAHRAIARTQADGGHTVYIDLAGQFDPVTAARCGLDIPALLLIRLADPHKAIALTRDLLANGSSSLIVLDAYCAAINVSGAGHVLSCAGPHERNIAVCPNGYRRHTHPDRSTLLAQARRNDFRPPESRHH